jgi:hypothetical protein
MPGALTIAGQISDVFYRLWAIGEVSPYLPDHLLGDALRLTQIITDDHGRAQVLGELAVRMAEPRRSAVLGKAVTAARACTDGFSRAQVLADLAMRQQEPARGCLLSEALDAARSETGDYRADALALAAAHMPQRDREEIFLEALDAARLIESPASRVETIGGLIPGLPREAATQAVNEALQLAQSIDADYIRILMTTAVLATRAATIEREQLLDNLHSSALASTGEAGMPMVGVRRVVRYLRFIPKSIRNELLAKAAEVAFTMDESRRLDIIFEHAALLRRLPRKLLASLLAAVESVPLNYVYTHVLGPIAVHLPSPFAEQAIADALSPMHGTRLARRGILNQAARLIADRPMTREDLNLVRRCLDTAGLEDCLSVLAAGVPLILAAGGPTLLDDCLATVSSTQRWWRENA